MNPVVTFRAVALLSPLTYEETINGDGGKKTDNN